MDPDKTGMVSLEQFLQVSAGCNSGKYEKMSPTHPDFIILILFVSSCGRIASACCSMRITPSQQLVESQDLFLCQGGVCFSLFKICLVVLTVKCLVLPILEVLLCFYFSCSSHFSLPPQLLPNGLALCYVCMQTFHSR